MDSPKNLLLNSTLVIKSSDIASLKCLRQSIIKSPHLLKAFSQFLLEAFHPHSSSGRLVNCKQSGLKPSHTRANTSMQHTLTAVSVRSLLCACELPPWWHPGRPECLNKGCEVGSGETGSLFVQHFGPDEFDTGPIVPNIKGAFFDIGDQTMVR